MKTWREIESELFSKEEIADMDRSVDLYVSVLKQPKGRRRQMEKAWKLNMNRRA